MIIIKKSQNYKGFIKIQKSKLIAENLERKKNKLVQIIRSSFLKILIFNNLKMIVEYQMLNLLETNQTLIRKVLKMINKEYIKKIKLNKSKIQNNFNRL